MSQGHQRQQQESIQRRADALRAVLHPILPFLEDKSVVEIMLNADGAVWVDRRGSGMERTPVHLKPQDALYLLNLIASDAGVELNRDRPSLAATLPLWGARVQALIPPLVSAPTFAIRKPPAVVFTLEDYMRAGILSQKQAEALQGAVRTHQSILVGGGTGSGKTTLTNALLAAMAETGDRVYIVEDTVELQCAAPNKVQVHVQPPFTTKLAIMAALRLRPDRIVVGEVRDGAALDLVKAWNTGHPGGLATVHANDTRSMLDRICQLVEEEIFPAPRAIIGDTINVCVHIKRDPLHPAGRSITGIDRVCGLAADGKWRLEPLVA